MPQIGFHGLVGLIAARYVTRRSPSAASESLVFGTVLGAMLPDIDMYGAAAAAVLGRSDLVYSIHRTATHSLVALAAPLVLAATFRKRRAFLCGLAIGMLTHLILDVFLWFAPLDFFWPFSQTSLKLPVIDLWANVRPLPTLILNIREACEFLAYALFVRAIRSISATAVGLARWEAALWVYFALSMVTSFVFRTNERYQNYVVTTPSLLVFLPFCWSLTWRFRDDIWSWAQRHRATSRISNGKAASARATVR